MRLSIVEDRRIGGLEDLDNNTLNMSLDIYGASQMYRTNHILPGSSDRQGWGKGTGSRASIKSSLQSSFKITSRGILEGFPFTRG